MKVVEWYGGRYGPLEFWNFSPVQIKIRIIK